MKLFYSTTSPYARKARVAIAECGLADRVELVLAAPFELPADLLACNPLSKIPALITDEGEALYDSPVICEYLDTLGNTPRLIPSHGPARWSALRGQALADGILDAGVLVLLEGRRPQSERSPAWVAKQTGVINRGLDAFEREAAGLAEGFSIAHITLGCALGWLDFRFPDPDWRTARPALAAWDAAFQHRPSMAATRPFVTA